MISKVNTMKVLEVDENKDGSATCTFDMDAKTTALAQELGLKLLLYCGATGTNLEYVFKEILGETDD